MDLLFVHIAIGAAAFGVPGYLLSRVLCPQDDGAARWATALVAGPIALGLVVTLFAVIGNVGVPRWGLLTISASLCLVAVALMAHHKLPLRWHLERTDWVMLAVAVAVFAVYLLHYDRTLFQFNCVNRAAALVMGVDPTGVPLDSEYLFAANRNVRLGNVSLVSPFFIAFGFVGPRLLYALVGAALFAWGALLGQRVLKHRWAATTLGLLLALNPYVLAIPILDENLFACLATTVILASLAEGTNRGVWIGLILGMLVGFRHMALLLVPAMLWALYRQSVQKSLWRALAITFGLIVGLWALHHHQAFGSPWAFESFKEYHVDHAHSLLGVDFGFRGLLNWPFHESLARTPYNPYPTIILLPLWLMNRLGLALLAFLPIGVLALRSSKLPGRVLAAMALPFWLLLSVMGNWMQPNKMGIVLIVLPCILLPIVAGLERLMGSWRRLTTWLTVVVSGVILASMQVGLAHTQTPVDARVYDLEDPVRAERDEYLTWERKHLVRHNVLPDWTRWTEYSRWAPKRKWDDLWFDLTTDQGISPTPRPSHIPDEAAKTLAVTLDLSQPLVGRSGWARASSEAPHWTLDANDTVFTLPELSWSSLKGLVAITTPPGEGHVHVVIEFDSLNLFPDLQATQSPQKKHLTQPSITLQLPIGTQMTVTEVVADHFSRYYRWTVDTRDGTATTEGPQVVFTN
jgi:hypothetical protein